MATNEVVHQNRLALDHTAICSHLDVYFWLQAEGVGTWVIHNRQCPGRLVPPGENGVSSCSQKPSQKDSLSSTFCSFL